MKKYYLNAPKKPEVMDDSLIAEMVLEKALRDFQKEKLLKEIDQSLLDNNKEKFIRLTNQLKNFIE